MTPQPSGAPVVKGFHAVLVAQFLSAMADNALLFAAIALLKAQGAPQWHTPLLQEFFVLAYIVLAPFVGHLADAWPKGRVMLVANALKLVGAALMLMGVQPLLAYTVVGVGAAAYSPAKYGILSELVPADKLVQANGMLEGATIVAILLGVLAGGYLADSGAPYAVGATLAVYLLATLANLGVPRTSATPATRPSLGAMLGVFWKNLRVLVKDPEGRFSLLGTSIFWGTGSTLRLLLVAWVPFALGMTDTATAANLNGAVAVGIALGAAAAARLVSLDNVRRAVPAGLALGLLIVGLAQVHSLSLAVLILAALGVCGGFFVVPLNALLQQVGHASVGSGNAIAIQNFFENVMMLLHLGAYVLLSKAGWTPAAIATAFGALVLAELGLLTWAHGRRPRLPA